MPVFIAKTFAKCYKFWPLGWSYMMYAKLPCLVMAAIWRALLYLDIYKCLVSEIESLSIIQESSEYKLFNITRFLNETWLDLHITYYM